MTKRMTRGAKPGRPPGDGFIQHSGRVAATLVAVVAMGLAGTSIAVADEGSPFNFIGQENPNIVVYPYSYNAQWQPGMDAALANWNATSSPVKISKSSSSTSTVTAASYSATWFGYYQSCGSTCL